MDKKMLTKRLIIREGYKLMRRKGYHSASIDEIVNNLKISKAKFYHFFKNKEDFALEVLHFYVSIALRRIEKILNNKQLSPKQRLIKIYSDDLDAFTNYGGSVYGNFAANMMMEIGSDNQKIYDTIMDFYNKLKEMHIECLIQAKRFGEIDKTKDVEKLTKLIIYSWEGAVLRAITTKNIRSLFLFRELLRDYILK